MPPPRSVLKAAGSQVDVHHVSARRAGQHARESTRRKARFWLLAMATMVLAAVAIVLVGELPWAGTMGVELLLLAGLLLIDRFAAPVVERWDRGADGEEHAGRLLEELEADGWLTLHDVDTGRGNYAQKKWLEGIAGRPVTALLVFSRAYLIGRAVSRQRGVVVLPARMLAGHLRRQPELLSAEEARQLHDRLGHALAPAPLSS